ncbi:hypothetical protein, partial [Spirosoma harenae]
SNDGKVIFFSEYKAVKTVSSLFTRICPLSVDDIHQKLARFDLLKKLTGSTFANRFEPAAF